MYVGVGLIPGSGTRFAGAGLGKRRVDLMCPLTQTEEHRCTNIALWNHLFKNTDNMPKMCAWGLYEVFLTMVHWPKIKYRHCARLTYQVMSVSAPTEDTNRNSGSVLALGGQSPPASAGDRGGLGG